MTIITYTDFLIRCDGNCQNRASLWGWGYVLKQSGSQNGAENILLIFKCKMAELDLTEDQVAELKYAFELFDQDRNGIITAEELGSVMQKLGFSSTLQELNELISEVDSDKSGTIDFQQFLALMANRLHEQNNKHMLEQSFKVFDKDGDGKISAAELKEVMGSIGENLSEEEVNEMMEHFDLDGDGQINFVEFVRMMSKS